MIGLSTMTFDLEGALLLKPDDAESDIASISRRINRQPTLDGSAYFSDSGHSAADNTLEVALKDVDDELDAAIRYLVKNYSLMYVTTKDGAFTGGVLRYDIKNGDYVLTILIAGEA